jgi:hypothetical protein
MKTEKLFELLTLVDGVRSERWETVLQLVDVISKGSVIIKDKKWDDSWKQSRPDYYPLDLAEIKTWSTYDNTCIDLNFLNDISKGVVCDEYPYQLVCKVKIYDGNSFGGDRRKLRFEALLWLPTTFIHTLEQRIEWAFNAYLEDAYENHLEAQKKLWINNMKSKIWINNMKRILLQKAKHRQA